MIEYAPQYPHLLTYDLAFLYTLTLTHNNHKDWRLPTADEYRFSESIRVNTWYDSCTWDNIDTDDYNSWHYVRYTVPVRSL